MSSSLRACAIPPPSFLKPVEDGGSKGFAVVSKRAWELKDLDDSGRKVVTYGFLKTLGYTDTRRDVVRYIIDKDFKSEEQRNFETWEDYANVKFSYRDVRVEDCDIRIAFQSGSSWSAVGEGSKDISNDKPTLNLGWLKDKPVVDENDRGTVLHEFGHALGLMHEHQSPARGQYIHLKELEIYKFYEPLLGSRALVKSQIIDTYNEGLIMNMSQLDLQSIMMYFMPGRLNEENITIPINTKLSKLDKAFIMLNYPPVLPFSEGGPVSAVQRRFMQAMLDAGVTNKAAGDILDGYCNPEPGNPNPSLASRLKKVRVVFSDYNESTTKLRSANNALANSIDNSSLVQSGIKDFLGSVVQNKLFQSVLKHVVQNVMVQQGIPLKYTIPGASPSEVANMVGGLSLHPEFAAFVKTLTRGDEDGAASSDIKSDNSQKAVVSTIPA